MYRAGRGRGLDRELAMGRLMLVLVAVVAVLLIGGAAVLAFWDIPPPSAPVEKVIPNDRFAR